MTTDDMLARAAELGGRLFSSARKLAEAADLSPATVANIVNGRSTTVRPSTAAALAAAWGIGEDKVYQLVRGTEAKIEPFRGPDGSETLTPYQREAVTKVINAFIRDNRREEGNDHEPEKKTDPAQPDPVGDDPRTRQKTDAGLTKSHLDLAARASARKLEQPRKSRTQK